MNQIVENRTNPKVDAFIQNARSWRKEYEALRAIILDCPLVEEFKWGKPCYSHDGKNVVLMHGFKEYCALLFMKGALLKDAKGILISQTENTQSARQIRFTSVQDIERMRSALKAYIKEAIEVERSGLKVDFKKTEEFSIPGEFQEQLNTHPALKSAFEALTPGRQRGYLLYFSGAKQAKTRASRVEKYLQKILDGKGMNDE